MTRCSILWRSARPQRIREASADDLTKAHAAFDRAVDRCYRKQPLPDERRRFEHLFGLYEQLIAPLMRPRGVQRGLWVLV